MNNLSALWLLMAWYFSTRASTTGLVLWHQGKSWHSAEYATMNFQLFRCQRKGWKCIIQVTFKANATNFMICKNCSLIGNHLIPLNVWLLNYFHTWHTIISCRTALSWQAWHPSSDAVLLHWRSFLARPSHYRFLLFFRNSKWCITAKMVSRAL